MRPTRLILLLQALVVGALAVSNCGHQQVAQLDSNPQDRKFLSQSPRLPGIPKPPKETAGSIPLPDEDDRVVPSKETNGKIKSAGRLARLDQVRLFQGIERDDEQAFTQFYDLTNGLLFGLVLHLLHDTDTAEEVLSIVYADIRQEAARFDRRRTTLLVWLITIAHWHAYEQLRSGGTSNRAAITPGERSARGLQNLGLHRSEHQRMLAAALAALSPAQLQMIELAYFSRMPPLEIALKLGQRLETVRVGLQDGMSKLCSLFKGDSPATSIKKPLPRVA